MGFHFVEAAFLKKDMAGLIVRRSFAALGEALADTPLILRIESYQPKSGR
ncbi:hypothetical protein [Virgibacillus salidurans]|nr:hypothetical protein [Virgibacillus sp. NKC19-16]